MKRISVNIPDALLDQLERVAELEGRPLADLVPLFLKDAAKGMITAHKMVEERTGSRHPQGFLANRKVKSGAFSVRPVKTATAE